jgi:hypothetical protein
MNKPLEDNLIEPSNDWRQHIKRDEVLELWFKAAENNGHHEELADAVRGYCLQRMSKDNRLHVDSAFEAAFKVNLAELSEWCTQIRDGLVRRADAETKATESPIIKAAIDRARLRIPAMLVGSDTGSRCSYKNVFERMMNQAAESSSEENQP